MSSSDQKCNCDDNVDTKLWLKDDDGEIIGCYCNPPMKFKLGDYVKVNYYDEVFPGNIVEIARVIRRYKVRMYTDGRTKEVWFDEDEIVDGFTLGEERSEMKSEKAFADKKTEYQKGFAAGYETRKIEEITEAVLNAESYGKTEDGKELRSVKDILEILNKYLPCE